MMYLRCAGLVTKDVKAGLELVIATEGEIPEKYRPHVDYILFPNVTIAGKILRVFVEKTGKITYTANEDIPIGTGINMSICYSTGKAAF